MDRRELITKTASALGYSVSGVVASSLLSACETKRNSVFKLPANTNIGITSKPGTSYQFFSAKQGEALRSLTDLILPKSATPGALEVGALDFVDIFVNQVFSQEDKVLFSEGLDQFLTSFSKSSASDSFSGLSQSDQMTFLQGLESSAFSNQADTAIDKFYKRFKTLIITGYYQSRRVGTEVLAYDPVPGLFDGCIEYSGRSWSLPMVY